MNHRHPHRRNLEKKRTTFFLIGLITALGSAIAVLEYRTYYEPVLKVSIGPSEEVYQLPPYTFTPAKEQKKMAMDAPKNEPTPNPEPVPDDKKVEPQKKKIEIGSDNPDDWGIKERDEPEKSEPVMMQFVQRAPIFPGCDRDASYEDSKACFEKAIWNYIRENTKYPELSKENGASGKVYVNFIINSAGEVSDVKVVRGVDRHLDAEAVRVIRSLPVMIPATQRDKPVNLTFTVPINFNLK
jgi:protein TonB